MEYERAKPIIEAILFASGKPIGTREISDVLDIDEQEIQNVLSKMKSEFEEEKRGIEIIRIDNSYQLCTKKEYYDYIYPIFDNKGRPNLSNAALETLSIICYNPKITRAEIESLRGVNSDSAIYRLLEYNLIEEAGKADVLGKPMTYKTTSEFLSFFGISSLDELPELPKYKIDANEQIVIDDLNEVKK